MRRIADRLFLILSTGFYAGYAPKAPGTIGTLVGIPIFLLLHRSPETLVTVAFLLLVAGIPLGDWAEKHFGKKDPQPFVLDEIVGYLLSVMLIKWDVAYTALAGFVLFRAFDIVKPPPIGRLQKLQGGAGIVLDDVLAGICANLVLRLWLVLFG